MKEKPIDRSPDSSASASASARIRVCQLKITFDATAFCVTHPCMFSRVINRQNQIEFISTMQTRRHTHASARHTFAARRLSRARHVPMDILLRRGGVHLQAHLRRLARVGDHGGSRRVDPGVRERRGEKSRSECARLRCVERRLMTIARDVGMMKSDAMRRSRPGGRVGKGRRCADDVEEGRARGGSS